MANSSPQQGGPSAAPVNGNSDISKAAPEKPVIALAETKLETSSSEVEAALAANSSGAAKRELPPAQALNLVERSVDAKAQESRQAVPEMADAEVRATLEMMKQMRLRRLAAEQAAQTSPITDNQPEKALGSAQLDSTPKPRRDLPADIASSYLIVGDKAYSRDKRDKVAFVDKADKLHTASRDPALATTFVRIADERGWTELRVKGTEDFRREVWLEASARGISVSGYKPDAKDKAELEIRASAFITRNAIEARSAAFHSLSPEAGTRVAPELAGAYAAAAATEKFVKSAIKNEATQQTVIQATRDRIAADVAAGKTFDHLRIRVPEGVIKAHGEANYNFDKVEPKSYYVTLAGTNGQERTLWGVDLKRAVGAAQVNNGDRVRLQMEESRNVKVTANVRDENQKVVGKEPIVTPRNQWRVEVIDRQSDIHKPQTRGRSR